MTGVDTTWYGVALQRGSKGASSHESTHSSRYKLPVHTSYMVAKLLKTSSSLIVKYVVDKLFVFKYLIIQKIRPYDYIMSDYFFLFRCVTTLQQEDLRL